MTPSDGHKPPGAAEKNIGEIVAEVSEKASLLVREEIELAKAEVRQKISSITKGVVVAVAAGSILFFAVVMLLETVAWFFVDLLDLTVSIWIGFGITTLILIVLAVIAGLLARRWLKAGSPPTPDAAIEEAKITRETLEAQSLERDQLERSLEAAKD